MFASAFSRFRKARPASVSSSSRGRLGLEALEAPDAPSVSSMLTTLNHANLGITNVFQYDWFSLNLQNSAMQNLARTDYNRDHGITRNDMIGLLDQAEAGGTVSSSAFHDLQTILANPVTLNMPGYVQYLGSQVVNGDPANAHFDGWSVGNLYAGCPAWMLADLTSKWFYGSDLPTEATGEPKQAYAPVNLPLFSGSGPAFTDVFQGSLGDCTVIASMAEVAARDNAAIQNMFINNGDNTYTVRFFEYGAPVYVTVNNELPGGGNLYDHPHGDMWVALAEKAYAQLNEEGWLPTVQPGTNSYTALDNGNATTMRAALAALSGMPGSTIGVNPTNIAAMIQAGDLVVLGTDNSTTNAYVEHNHAYAVLGYNPSASLPFTLFNPWGVNGGYDGTTGHYVWSEFVCNASFLSANFWNGGYATGGLAPQLPGAVLTVNSVMAWSGAAAAPNQGNAANPLSIHADAAFLAMGAPKVAIQDLVVASRVGQSHDAADQLFGANDVGALMAV